MINKSKMLKIPSFALVVTGFVLFSGILSETIAQNRDPFEKPGWAKPKTNSPATSSSSTKSSNPSTTSETKKPTGPVVVTRRQSKPESITTNGFVKKRRRAEWNCRR